MTNSLLQWHLARDNQQQLAAFCDKHKVKRLVRPPYDVAGGGRCYRMYTAFENGGWIEAEIVQGLSIAEHYQVTGWGLGTQ